MVAEAGSAGFTTIQDVFEKEPVPAKKQLDIFTEVSSGASDVGVIDAVMAGYYITSETGAYHESLSVVEIEGVEKEFYAVGCREKAIFPPCSTTSSRDYGQTGPFVRSAKSTACRTCSSTDSANTTKTTNSLRTATMRPY